MNINIDQLKAERIKNLERIGRIEAQIEVALSQKQPVNELYGRINHLSQKNTEIEMQLSVLTPAGEGGNDDQMEKAKAIACAGGGIIIRPSLELIHPGQDEQDERKPIIRRTVSIESKAPEVTTVFE